MNGWRKSTYSMSTGDCLEAASGDGVAGVRDSKNRGTGPVLEFSTEAWARFVSSLR